MDWENSYYTMSDENNLHNWHLIKTYFVTEGYKEVTHSALFMKFPLKDSPDEHFLIFTTTPWTVPANVAIAVNPNIEYVKVDN